MTAGCGCGDCSDHSALVRDGTDQERRTAAAPNPDAIKVDARQLEHGMVFASAYAGFLEFFAADGTKDGNWRDFFAADPLARVAIVATEDVARYRRIVHRLLAELQDPLPTTTAAEAMRDLRAVFDCVGTLAAGIDGLATSLAAHDPLRRTARDLITSRLSEPLRLLIACFRAGSATGDIDATAPVRPGISILGGRLRPFADLMQTGLSEAWPAGVALDSWSRYAAVDPAEGAALFGSGIDALERINHLVGHNRFTSACEAFLGVLARLVDEAVAAIRSRTVDADHQPHYALFLSFLDMLQRVRSETDALPGKHLDFYFRSVLGLREREAQPSHAHVLAELAKHVDAHLIPAGTGIKAGKDAHGAELLFTAERDLVVNRAKVVDIKRGYRHPVGGALPQEAERLFADTVVTDAGPWHPFAEQTYADGTLTAIAMPHAELGFAIASHLLRLAGGTRTIGLRITSQRARAGAGSFPARLRCRLTTEKGWHETAVDTVQFEGRDLTLDLTLTGGDPPIVPFDATIHGFGFDTDLPVLLVQLVNETGTTWSYPDLVDDTVQSLTLSVTVAELRELTLANDHGPIDPSKPFLPFGATPTAGSALLIGSQEAFQKQPAAIALSVDTMVTGTPSGTTPTLSADELVDGAWRTAELAVAASFEIGDLTQPQPADPGVATAAQYSTAARSGFVRLVLSDGYGTQSYPLELAKYIAGKRTGEPPRPELPLWQQPTLSYHASQQVGGPQSAQSRLLHVTPFGWSVLQPGAPLLPRFLSGATPAEGELLLGIDELRPPQSLALLLQVVDGTANPLVVKPERHVAWSYLRGDAWVDLPADAVADGTDALLASGIVTLAVPGDATTEHTLLPRGRHWIRAAVTSLTDAVSRLREVSAQALVAAAVVDDAHELPPGTLSALTPPEAAIKGITQPYPTFGGRAAESQIAFATRASERLRHKDRATTIWDYEHLVLEAFPTIYSARCLNHTRYEPTAGGTGIYRELAAGHVTIVTVPDLVVPDARDPLRPSTSLRLLGQVERFLQQRTSCFVQLHVRNPQFEQVRCSLRVRLREGVDETFHVNRLQREITEFLSPWAYRSAVRPSFNGRVRKSVLVDFIEERDYVDYLTDVRLFRLLPGSTGDGPDLDEVSGSRAVSILVSAPPVHHTVTVIHDDQVDVGADCGCSEAVAS